MKIFGLNSSKRSLGNAGGVELHTYYLEKALGLEPFIQDEKQKLLNIAKKGDIVIGDGYNVDTLDPDFFKVISVVHGSWKEFAIRNKREEEFKHEWEHQERVWQNWKIKKVAVSLSAAKYLKKHHGVKADAIILNGVDTNLFKPREKDKRAKPVVIYAGKDSNKTGHKKLYAIEKLLKDDFEFRYLSAEIGEEHIKMAQGDLFIAPSRYEGNSYAALQAMACDLPVIVSDAGLFEDTVFNFNIGEIVCWDFDPEDWAKRIKFVWSKKSTYHPRGWILQNAKYEIFASQWQKYINSL